MNFKTLLAYSLLFGTLLSCKNDDAEDCSLVDCLGVDNSIYFEIINGNSQENLLTNGTFQTSDITVRDSNTDMVAFEIQNDFQNEAFLVIDLDDEDFGVQEYQVRVGNDVNFTLALETSFMEAGACCGPYTGTEEINLTGVAGGFGSLGTLPLTVTILVP
ncbi:hypothetical protein [Flagellimonas flava]|uniref:Lipoprotein n=1 Tax=Flagellimonas flava TaxID=570519 RepID=A0A1M5JWY8_9FLAO|nr:hypothetical protein [Allomuricauda flava]SHG44895.1 hypothetical protein SAMN04488116_1256 [Allomuricauda flava]